jgi:esterase/lipase superfamily enzyme
MPRDTRISRVAADGSRWTLVLAALAMLALTGCSRAPELIGIDVPDRPPDAAAGITRHRIFIASTRARSDAPGALLAPERARTLGLASADVLVPPTHVVGQLTRPRRLPPDPRTDFMAVDPVIYEGDGAFIAAINRELAARPVDQRTILLFVHGFNNTPTDSLLRLGQFVEDSNFEGVPVLLSWASAARALRYVHDLNSALVARDMVPRISDILARTRARDVDVFAHSMGSLLTMEGLVERERSGGVSSRKHINSIVLAAPDIDIDLFRTQLRQLRPETRSAMYLLISENDPALRVSSGLAGGVPRVGAAPLEELEEFGLTVIDLSHINDSSAGTHAAFAGSPEVVQLIGAGLDEHGRFGDDTSPVIEQILRASPIRILPRGIGN